MADVSFAHMLTNECPLCSNNQSRASRKCGAILGLPETLDLQVAICSSCRFTFLSPYLSQDEIEALYSKAYFTGKNEDLAHELAPQAGADYETSPFLPALVRKFETSLDLMVRYHPGARSILDIGAATGEFLRCAERRGLTITGIELSSHACNRALERHGISLINQGIDRFIPPHKFDLIHLNHVLEHFPHPHTAVSRISQLLAPGGFVYIEVPFQFNVVESVKYDIFGIVQPFTLGSMHHPIFFSPPHLIRLFRMHHMKPVHINLFNWRRAAPLGLKRKIKSIAWMFLALAGQGQYIEALFKPCQASLYPRGD